MSIEEKIRQFVGESVDASYKALLNRVERLERLSSCNPDGNEVFTAYSAWLRSQQSFPTPLESFREGWKAAIQRK